jgi:hypothetical protein
MDRNSVTYLASRLSYEYGVPFQSIIELPPMAFKAHIEVLKDLGKERNSGGKNRNTR